MKLEPMEPMEAGFYRPTEAFKSIPEHAAVMRSSDQALIALVGPSNDPNSIKLAEAFALLPEVLDALDLAATTLAFPMSSATRERVATRIRELAAKVRAAKVK